MKKLIVGISGATGVIYGIRLLEVLRTIDDVETHLVMSPYAKLNIEIETSYTPAQVESLADERAQPPRSSGFHFQRLIQDGRHGDRALFDEDLVGDCEFLR